jgi:hypothetical protein
MPSPPATHHTFLGVHWTPALRAHGAPFAWPCVRETGAACDVQVVSPFPPSGEGRGWGRPANGEVAVSSGKILHGSEDAHEASGVSARLKRQHASRAPLAVGGRGLVNRRRVTPFGGVDGEARYSS